MRALHTVIPLFLDMWLLSFFSDFDSTAAFSTSVPQPGIEPGPQQ